jgi:hypothetical protein
MTARRPQAGAWMQQGSGKRAVAGRAGCGERGVQVAACRSRGAARGVAQVGQLC